MLKNKRLKLIIWDLDETLWDGSIMVNSDVTPHKDLIDSIKELNGRGVISSICSNNYYNFCAKILKNLDIWDLFIMPNMNYKSKGIRIKEMIEDFQLSPQDVLFIDDNQFNLIEVGYYNPKIQVFDASNLDNVKTLMNYLISINDVDNHRRFKNYKVIEDRTVIKKDYDDNEEFLRLSDVTMSLDYNVVPQIDRAHELIHRTNQLNYTKNRKSKEELINDVQNNKSFLVSVKDKYGDYGVVGFVCYSNNEVQHFTFSCRILNMGITDYVYNMIGKPEISVSGEVAVELSGIKPDWVLDITKKDERNV